MFQGLIDEAVPVCFFGPVRAIGTVGLSVPLFYPSLSLALGHL